ncbi:hypothetical protein [Noviherbaspirillum saxi]|uniref:Uncharacterized protein n=1 Tax=Noviherbaspirillum saxi TaxID=2320863 RepID=A0A3A3FU06_9BURK|nr:hypothetical protein [Noviherbaspirillum saxi]RJF99020.1 hypothetical protein D3871_11245 [Noviherbaspirillum saxi]
MNTAVKILKAWSIYSPGDIAGFDEERAASLVKSGIAEPHKDGAKKDAAKSGAGTGKDAGSDSNKAVDPAAGK